MNRLARLTIPAVLLLASCDFAGADVADGVGREVASTTAVRVEIAVLQPSDARLELTLPGEIEGSRDALLGAPLGGYVERVLVDDGEAVRAGQAIVRIDAEIYAARLEQAEAQLALAESELVRLEKLGDLGTASQRDQAETQVKVTRAGVRLAKGQLSRAIVTAPFDGVVSGVAVERGEVASPGTPVARLVQLDPVKVTLSVADHDIIALEPGMEVLVSATARSGIYPGTITFVGTAADLRTRSFPVEVEVPNGKLELLPGMIARVTTARTLETGAIVIPQEWVVIGLEGQGVYLDVGGIATWRPVVLGRLVRDQVVVDEGLSPGDRVVITGHRDLVPGDEVLVSREGVCCTGGRPVFEGAL